MRSINKDVIVKLKNNTEYKGCMVKCDNYLNILLERATEVHGSNPVANYGSIFIRGNNILYVCLRSGRLP